MISIITPTNNDKYLLDVFQHLLNQTYQEWEWILVLNGELSEIKIKDKRIKTFVYDGEQTGNIGALKKFACSKASGEYILELDHDDYLMPTALEKVSKAFESGAMFVYSDDLGIRPDFTWNEYRADYGWVATEMEYKGRTVKYHKTPAPIAQHISKIWFAPDHLRAWRKDIYDKIGGHDETLTVADDHDLMCRMYLEGDFHYIDECLYIYNIHGDNTWLKRTDDIQVKMWQNYDKYIEPMMMEWSRRNLYLSIDLCGAIDKPKGYLSIDRHNADMNCDLNGHWDVLESNSVGLLRANDAIEHLKDPIRTMNEAYRVLAHGGMFMIDVPSTDGKGAWCDPTHVSFWNDRSFRYYTEAHMRRYLEPECNCRFQISKLENVIKYDGIPFVRAHLIAVKNGDRIMGPLYI